MKKIQILGIAVCAIVSLCIVMASTAFGDATHLWLINGNHITGSQSFPINDETEILVEEMTNRGRFLCSLLFVGTVLAEGKDEFTLVEDLIGSNVEGNSNTLSINCFWDDETGSTGVCEGVTLGQLVFIFPLNLPWQTELELVGTMWIDLITNTAGNPGYLIECTVLGIKADISCVGNTGMLVENETGGVLDEFEPENAEVTARLKCTSPLGEGEGLISDDVVSLITSSSGTLSISEP